MHCLANGGGYSFAGIGLDLISVSGIYDPNSQTSTTTTNSETSVWAQMKDGFDERKEKIKSCLKEKSCLKKKVFGLSELSVGVGFTYDYSPNRVSRELLALLFLVHL